MKFQSKTDLHQYLGRPNMFKKKVEVKKSVFYSGLEGKNLLLTLKIYPKGIFFTDDKAVFIGIRTEDVKECEIISETIDKRVLIIRTKLARQMEFDIVSEQFNSILFQLRLKRFIFTRSCRELEKTEEEIKELADEFSKVDTELSLKLNLLDTSTFGNLKILEIQPSSISWKDKSLKVEDTTGFSYGITINRFHGVAISRDFDIRIHTNSKYPFIISFSKKAGVSTLIEDEKAFEDIIAVLFNLILRKRVVDWLNVFSINKIVEYKEFNLSKEGVLIKNKGQEVQVFWDEIDVYPDIIRWKFSNQVFVHCDAHYDRRPLMLMKFLAWLNEEEDRMKKLLGTDNFLTSPMKNKFVDYDQESFIDFIP